MRVILTVTDGPHVGEVFPFDGHTTFLVGRSPEAHLSLAGDDYLSRLHFLIEVNPPLCRLVDMKSTHGTLVNGHKVKVADLSNGDLIRAGQTALRVVLSNPQGNEASTTHDEPPPVALGPTLYPEQPGLPGGDFILDAAVGRMPRIPGYELIRELGHGAMGVVYLVRRLTDGCEVALKTIKTAHDSTPQDVQRFLREAVILQQLKHPHIVPFHEMGGAGRLLYFVMDFVRGINGRHLLHTEGPLSIPRAVALMCQVLDALGCAHVEGFVHRDVKPSNVMVTQREGQEVAFLTDFGLARTYQGSQLSGLTLTNSTGGTPGFMPPEQVRDFRSAKPAADQYAAGATLYRLLTNKPLFEGVEDNNQLFREILQSNPVPIRDRRPEVPEELASAIHRSLTRDPEQRFADVTVFREALMPFALKAQSKM